MAKIKSLSAETDKKIQNKEKEIQDIDAKKQKLVKELKELKSTQQRERNDGVGKLLKEKNIDPNQFGMKLQENPDIFEMILMMMNEHQEQEETETDTASGEEQAVTESEEYATVCDDDADDDFID